MIIYILQSPEDVTIILQVIRHTYGISEFTRCIFWLGLVLAASLSTNMNRSYMWKAILPWINTASTALRRGASLPAISKLPPELLTRILVLTLASNVPFRLEEFIELGKSCQSVGFYGLDSASSNSCFLWQLHPSQREHYLDWLAINGTSRNFRECGKLVFFSEKTFIITPNLLKDLQDGNCKNMSASDKAAVFSHARHVIAPMGAASMATRFAKLPTYNAFTRIRVLTIQPFIHLTRTEQLKPHSEYGDLHPPDLETASTPMASQPLEPGDPGYALDRGTPKRHPAPQELLDLLEGLDLQVGRMEVDLLHRDTEKWRRYVIDEITSQVYPYLRYKMRRRVAQGQRSSAAA